MLAAVRPRHTDTESWSGDLREILKCDALGAEPTLCCRRRLLPGTVIGRLSQRLSLNLPIDDLFATRPSPRLPPVDGRRAPPSSAPCR
jgi:hypothetical protein